MPELPDVTIYVEALAARLAGARLERVRVRGPFVLRSVEPAVDAAEGRRVVGVERLGKRIVLELEGELFLVIHLMIAGRLRWADSGAKPTGTPGTPRAPGTPAIKPLGVGKIELASFIFDRGTLVLTEAGTKKRASLHVVGGRAALAAHDPGGIDLLMEASTAVAGPTDTVVMKASREFGVRLRRGNHTLKRALADPRLFSGIGNAYSDEILHAARLSPLRLTGQLSDEEALRLFEAARRVLLEWTDRLRREFGMEPAAAGAARAARSVGRFPGPGEITAFREGFAVHGRFGLACPVCGTSVQRIVYAENECNYCPRCQTGGKVLADRSMSRLLKGDWPRTVEELEELEEGRG